jgi:hypothetical protein
MKAENPYVKLFQVILPSDIASFFDLVDVTEKDGVDDRRVHLHVRRRRWLDNSTGKSVSKDWDLVAQCVFRRYPFTFSDDIRSLFVHFFRLQV